MKKIVYTVLFGDYRLNEPKCVNKGWDLICFSDRDRISKSWSVVKVDVDLVNLKKKSREIKIRYDRFIDCDLCLYLDAKFVVKCDLDNFVRKNLTSNMAVMKHNKRTCAYDEALFCIEKGYENKDVLYQQTAYYKKVGFPIKFGLYAPGIMIRKNTSEVIKFMKLWYDEVNKHSYRDQISFPYVLWNNPIKIDLMPFKETYAKFK